MDILDQYVVKFPTEQNVVDLFDGEWSSRMPKNSGLTSKPGTAALFEDDRVIWAEQVLGGFSDQDVLELGPLECAHSYMLHQRGAKTITSIEANSRAFLKCVCVKQLFKLDRVDVKLGDFVAYLRANKKKFDLTIASGVLYHMQEPIELLHLIGGSANRVFIWTHYYDEKIIASNRSLAPKFKARESASYNGFNYEFSRQFYKQALGWAGFCGGPEEQSVWLTRESILECLKHLGFSRIEVAFESKDHPNGPSFAICGSRDD
jgi:hypothetical protein